MVSINPDDEDVKRAAAEAVAQMTEEMEDHMAAMSHLGQEDRGCKLHSSNRGESVIYRMLTDMEPRSLSSLQALF